MSTARASRGSRGPSRCWRWSRWLERWRSRRSRARRRTGRSRSSSSPPPASTRATASGSSPAPTICSTTRSSRRCSTWTRRPASTPPASPRSGRPSADYKEWTFFLRKGVTFHYGFGPFTARDVVHSHSFMMRQEATATLAGFWRTVEEVKVINDHQVVFRMKRPTTVMPYAASRAGDLRMVSKAQWDKEGQEGFDKRPAGTGSYRYVGRQPGLSVTYERIDNHWKGEKPAVQGARVPRDPRGVHAAGPAPLRRGAHRRPAPRAPEGRDQEGHEDLLVVVPGGLDVGVPGRPVLPAGGSGVQAGRGRGPRSRCARR